MTRIPLLVLTLPLALTLAACDRPEGVGFADDPGDACKKAQYQSLLGQDESVLAGMTFATPVRGIHPGTAVTMDYSPSRLNIYFDETGKIARLTCG